MGRWLMRFCKYDERDKLVRVKSWLPSFDEQGMWWPTLLIDRYGYQRETSTRLWPWFWK